jgi:UDP-glucose 4-epimerase
MRVLVTGGAGYIGSHTVVELVNAGHEVVVVDNLSNSQAAALERIEEITGRAVSFTEVDVRDEAGLDRVFASALGGVGVDSVIHFAGLKAVGESVADPLAYYDNNVVGTVSLLKAMGRAHVRNLLFSSSATVYGAPEHMPIREDAPLGALNPYGQTKLDVEEMLRDLAASDASWHMASLRYFNPVGAHESGLIGEDPTGVPMNLVPFVSQVAVGRRDELTINGSDYPTPDGTCIRDYVHVVDIALGHVAVLEALADRPGAHAWNLGTGRGSSVLDVVAAFESVIGRPVATHIGPRRPGDAPVSVCDPTRAELDFGWKAVHTLDDMCRDAWRWQSMNPMGFTGPREPSPF